MESYKGWVWDDYDLYEATRGDTWDDMAYRAYGDETLCSLLLSANPDLCDVVVMDGGEEIVIPIIERAKSELSPPWRQ